MKKSKLIFLGGLSILVVTGAAWFFIISPREPSYGGRPLHEWLKAYDKQYGWDAPEILAADDAIRHIGKKALPFLLGIIVAQPSDGEWSPALRPFAELRDIAKPAVPTLARMLYQKNTTETAAHALGMIGAEGLPVLVEAAASTNTAVRAYALLSLLDHYQWCGPTMNYGEKFDAENWRAMQASEKSLVPTLIRCVQDAQNDARTRDQAICILGDFHRQPEVVIPVLLEILKSPNNPSRRSAALHLGGFGEQGQTAVPLLTQLLQDPEPKMRELAAYSLQQINSANRLASSGSQ